MQSSIESSGRTKKKSVKKTTLQSIKYYSLRAVNWLRKIANPYMKKAFKTLKEEGYIIKTAGMLSYNRNKALPPLKLASEIEKSRDSLKRLRASNEFTANLPLIFPLVITLREMVPTEKIKKNPLHIQYKIWKEILSNIPICAVPSTDRYRSFGMVQMTKETYYGLKKLFPRLLKENFHECISYRCQARAAFLLAYSNLNDAWRYLRTKKRFMKAWNKASVKEKRRFVVYIASLTLNAGWNSQMVKILGNVFDKGNKKFNTLSETLSLISEESNRIKENNDSGTYAKNVLNFYDYLITLPAYSRYNESAFTASKALLSYSETGKVDIEKGGLLKKVERKSKKTGNTYMCYIFTIDGKNKRWNERMLKALLRRPAPSNIKRILDFNGIKEIKGPIAIPEHFFDKSIGEEFIVIKNKWKTYKAIVRALTKAKTKKQVEKYRAVLYALNNSKEAGELKKIRIPVKFLKIK